MTDQLYLALWLNRHKRSQRLRVFEQLLRLFPFSQRPQPQTTVSVLAVDLSQPPVLEYPMNGPIDPDEASALLAGYQGDDVAYQVESWWDLWQFDGRDYQLSPARVLLSCFGPEFEGRVTTGEEDVRVDFGVDSLFLPQVDMTASAGLVQSNIRSLLRLVHEIESTLPVERRRLETESGENFADRLQEVLQAASD